MFIKSKISIKDTSGLKKIKCIKFLGNNSFKKQMKIGDLVIGSTVAIVKRKDKRVNTQEIKLAQLNKCLVVTTKQVFFKKDGSCFHFDSNTAIKFNKELKQLDVTDKRKKYKLKLFVPIIKQFFYKNCKQLLAYGKVVYQPFV